MATLFTAVDGVQPASATTGGTGYERSLLWELPFWLGLFFWSLYPSVDTPWYDVATVPVSSKDLVALGLTSFYLVRALASAALMRTFSRHDPAPAPLRPPWHCHLPILTIGIVAYAALSTTWSTMPTRDSSSMLYTLLSTASGVALGYLLVANRSPASIQSFLWRLTLYLTALGLLYAAESFFSLGLRSEAGIQLDSGDFGIQRVRGPLFASSTGFFILLPAMAFAIQQLIQRRAQRLLSCGLVLGLILTLLSLGSRAGLLLLGLYFLLMLFAKDKQKGRVISMVIPALLLAVGLVFSVAETSRLEDLIDEGRLETHRTSWQIITNRSWQTNLRGSGYGSYWPWYLPDVELGSAELYNLGLYTDLVSNPYGMLLYHPHSTLLLLAVELGVPGLLYLLALWVILLRALWRSLRGGEFALFGIGVVVSAFSMFVDFFLFRMLHLSVLWWAFLFGALALTEPARRPVEKGDAVASEVSPGFRAFR